MSISSRSSNNSDIRVDFYHRMSARNLTPLWETMAALVTPSPKPVCVPAICRYDDVRPFLLEGGRLITAVEAERRVIVLENPGIRGCSQITQSLYAGLQLVLPGAIAASHRHAASALRFVIEGGGAYTSVDGERIGMKPGDFVTTPSWTFHDHGNTGDEPAIWLDGLNLPIVNTFDASFAERYCSPVQPVIFEAGYSELRYSHAMLPCEGGINSLGSRLFHYPYKRARKVLKALGSRGDKSPYHGVKMQYVNPTNGSAATTTMSAYLQLLPKNFEGRGYRSTDATIYHAVEGSGRSIIDGQEYRWKEKDVFIVPSWAELVLQADTEDSILFSFSDRPAQKSLGIWRDTD
jgi:gentisate 1,2-dioxygenase